MPGKKADPKAEGDETVRGRKPRPTQMKVIAGNPGKRPLNRHEPEPPGELGEPPDWMTESQKDGWRYALANSPPGMLKAVDRAILTIWVCAEDLHRIAARAVAEHGALVKSPVKGEPMQSPFLPIMNKQAQLMLKAAEQLGFSPVSRPRISVTGYPVEENGFARFRKPRLVPSERGQ